MEIEVFIQQVEQRLQKFEARPNIPGPKGDKGDPGEGLRGIQGKPGDISKAIAHAEKEARTVAAEVLDEFRKEIADQQKRIGELIVLVRADREALQTAIAEQRNRFDKFLQESETERDELRKESIAHAEQLEKYVEKRLSKIS